MSYLFFADYLVLFGKVDEKNWQSIKDALDVFCDLSKKKVNYGKFRVYFSPNIFEDREEWKLAAPWQIILTVVKEELEFTKLKYSTLGAIPWVPLLRFSHMTI